MSEIIKMRPLGRMRIVRTPGFSAPSVDTRIEPSMPARTDSIGEPYSLADSASGADRKGIAEQSRNDEYERGLSEGKRQVEELLKREYDRRIAVEEERIGQLMESIGEQFSMFYRKSEEAVIKFSFGIAQRIIGRETSVDKDIILNQIKEGVTRILGVEKIKIRVHPDDLATVRGHRDRIQANSDALREVVVESDEHLECGDCILESDLGNIDARMSTQLKQIENMLFESKVVN